MKLDTFILVQLAVLLALASPVLSDEFKMKYVKPAFVPMQSINEQERLPDTTYPRFQPGIDRPRLPLSAEQSVEDGEFIMPALGQTIPPPPEHVEPVQPEEQTISAATEAGARPSFLVDAKSPNQKPWWQRWRLPWSTGAQVAPDNSMKSAQTNEVAAAAPAESAARSSAPIVTNSANQKSWLPQWKSPWSLIRAPAPEAAPISSTQQLRSWLRPDAKVPTMAGEKPNVPILSVASNYPGVRLPGNEWDGQIVRAMSQRGGSFVVSAGDKGMWLVTKNGQLKQVVDPHDRQSFHKAMEKSQLYSEELPKLDLAASQAVTKTANSGGLWSGIAEKARGTMGAVGGARSSLWQYLHGV
ncbi:uncharacterized protein SRS1_11231 [Sporisorium reilianum f. sp. reilianum]|uniref:Uncharacterized protein n=1 Tax=Sporisorium reilianum f. sp. reilianum TaxID=72559 RepID=A0A2N8UGU5_9BASI|nr:uncharacterized protein SRS1_11231 [Sporisorium reilianum f. sp. reilianum]